MYKRIDRVHALTCLGCMLGRLRVRAGDGMVRSKTVLCDLAASWLSLFTHYCNRSHCAVTECGIVDLLKPLG